MSRIIVEQENTQELKTLVRGALDSETFYRRYSAGEMGDRIEYIKWAGEVETLKRLQENLTELSEAEIC